MHHGATDIRLILDDQASAISSDWVDSEGTVAMAIDLYVEVK